LAAIKPAGPAPTIQTGFFVGAARTRAAKDSTDAEKENIDMFLMLGILSIMGVGNRKEVKEEEYQVSNICAERTPIL
jgi:hypothetical protein